MRDLYADDGQKEIDEFWIPEIAQRGWMILTADKKKWWRPREQQAIIVHGAKVFSLHKGQLREVEKTAECRPTATQHREAG
ncbi:hypothetical protein D3250_03735 [Nesterenkonia natronophila]|uniref:VapC45 PIN like domain-containing protein n=2 Tax=Nesterenkonia natronophila TaxID=2174932 RepID=A0A3A4F4D3_9MICC|nr:hypothetical protein D3250_03735 [Nesterenkonia natronophila]